MESSEGQTATVIEHIVEGKNVVLPDYSRHTFTAEQIEKGKHREFVVGKGGDWEEGGRGQLDFLKSRGLRPDGGVMGGR